MAKSVATQIEVRWREEGTEAWSASRTFPAMREIVINGLDREKTYEFEWRGISECGAKSDWGSTLHQVAAAQTPPPVVLIAATSLADGVHLSWSTGTYQAAGIEYAIERSSSPSTGFEERARTRSTACTDPETSGSLFYYRVRTVAFGDIFGAYSDVVSSQGKIVQDGADNSQDTVGPAVINPRFDAGDKGWSNKGVGWAITNGKGERTGNSGTPTAAMYNDALRPVVPGERVMAQCVIQGFSANGTCAAALQWFDPGLAPLGLSSGNTVTGQAGSTLSRVTATAPAGAYYVAAAAVAANHTAGSYRTDYFSMTLFPNSVDELPDGSSYGRSMAGFHSETVDNATFGVPIDPQGNVPGWKPFTGASLAYTSSAAYNNANVLDVQGTTQNCGAESTRKYACRPGDYISLKADVYSASSDLSHSKLQVRFYRADGTAFTEATGNISAATSGFNAWEVLNPHGTAPANAAYFTLLAFNPGNTGSGLRLLMTNVRLSVNDVRVAGSGAKLGNAFTAPNSLTLNVGAVRSTTALSASSSGAVSVNAFTYYSGSASVQYNAVANAVTGLSPGGAYWIYCHDPGPSGGTVTWLATQNVNTLQQTYDDIVVAGQITVPTSGSSTGGGGGDCVCDDMFVAEGLRAGDAREGDVFDCLDLPRLGLHKFQRVLHSVERRVVECVQLTTDAGAVWKGSATTPFDLPDGRLEWAPHMKGEQVVTDWGIETVVRVEHIGPQPVSHVHLGGCSYPAGADPKHRVYSHNPIAKK